MLAVKSPRDRLMHDPARAPKLNKDWADHVGGRQQGAEYKSKMFD
jgi:hypothetical protein